MECPSCKAENRPGVRYCSNCGKQLATTGSSSETENTLAASSAVARSLSPGSRLQGGRYTIKRVLGQGGMGAALLATDYRLDGKPVVIKELLADPATAQDDVRNFRREVSTLAHIDHPLIPNVTDHFQEGTRYFMVQEYVEGETLEERMELLHQPMRERDVLIYASEVLDILDYLSMQTPPIVHRDIKPANIIISTKDRHAHLVDFGIARADITRNAQRKQTSALGTPGYAPPEQYQGNADPRSDLYALGATLHYLFTNRDPRNHPPFIYPPVRTFNPQLSPEIEPILRRALVNDINQRYQSAAEMKRDIDAILQQRYGISGTLNAFMVGASNMQDAVIVPPAPPAPATPQPPVLPPVIPTPITPTPSSPTPVAQKQKRRNTPYIILLLLLLLLLLLGGVYAAFVYLLPHHAQTNTGKGNGTTTITGIGVTKRGNESIGISDGTIALDVARTDGTLKQQAASALKQNSNNTSTAISLLNQAITQDSSDAEAHIYLENLRVTSSGSPYVTIVVTTMLSGDPGTIQVGRDDLQGAYVAQKEFNVGAKLYNGAQVRLLIANTGSQTSYATQVAQQIVQLAQSDKTFVGVMGWPYSSRALQVIRTLSQAHIPSVSPTASSDELSGISQYFFRVAPSNKIQGVAGAKYAEQVLHAHKAVLFFDPGDPYSQSLAQDFSTQFQGDGNQIVKTEQYTVGKPASLPSLLQDALQQKPDMLYFSGYANDIGTLLTDLPPSNMPIMGGDALYELGGYPSSARAGFSHLHFTAFAYPDEWGVLGFAARSPSFFTSYPAAFDPNRLHQGSPYGFTRADNDAILAYDATTALLNGVNLAMTQSKQTHVTPEAVRQGLTQVTGSNAFQGVSGQIAFAANGDPIDKSIVILYVDPNGFIKMEPTLEGKFLLGS